MDIDFFTDKIIIVNFPAFSGGKFIMNCLSLSKHSTPLHSKITNYLIDRPDDYDYRLNAVLSTLPPPDNMKNWREKWEFGDTEFYNGQVKDHLTRWKNSSISNDTVDTMLSTLISKQICFFMTAHGGPQTIEQIVSVWPNARIITLINSEKFWNIAINLKTTNTNASKLADYAGNECQSKYQILKGSNWPDWNIFEKCHYNVDKVSTFVRIKHSIKKEIKQFYPWHKIKNDTFCIDVDNSFFDKESFLKTICNLYTWIKFDDFNPTLVEQYYQQYISLHLPITKQE
jgi:hypothetical protein